MPEPDRARLGSGHIRLDAEVVQFLPSKWEAWRGISAVSFAYTEVASVVMTEPEGFGRGTLVVRLDSGESHSMSFGSNRLPKLRQTYREMWRRVQAARGDDPGPSE
jgi:hypothetical protein